MGLVEHLSELKKELEEAEQRESAQDKQDDPLPEPVIEPETKPEPEPEKPAEPVPEVKPDPAPPIEPEPDANAYQRMRREKAASDKRARELEEEVTRLKTKPEESFVPTAPEPAAIPEAMVRDWQKDKAKEEFRGLGSEFQSRNPDYGDVMSHYLQGVAQSIKTLNPRMSAEEIATATEKEVLTKASKYARDGFNAAEEIYHDAKGAGFRKKAPPPLPEAEPEKEIKPDLSKVAENRSRSTNMTAGRGREEAQVTLRTAADYSPAEWMKVSPADKRRILAGG